METIVLQPVQQEFTDFMSLPMGVYKNIQYYNSIQSRSFFESSLCKKDGCTYYSHTVFTIKKSKNGFYRHNTVKDGFTINEKGKLSVWFGKSIFQVPGLQQVFNHFNLNWFNNKLQGYVTKSIAEKMITGKITNNTEVLKAYIKVMRLNCSPKLLSDVIIAGYYAKPMILSMIHVAKDQNHFLEWCMENPCDNAAHYLTLDLVKQAHILGRKVDFKWSDKRMREEHDKWTKEIMDIEVNDMQDVVAENLLPFLEFNYPGFKLLTTKKEVYAEGKSMSHCVYTNYWQSVERKHYMVYQVEYMNQRATLGCYISDSITFNQCYCYKNTVISTELNAYVNKFIADLNIWAKENNIIHPKPSTIEEISF